MFFSQRDIKLKINDKENRNSPTVWKLSNPLINNPWVEEGISVEIRQYFEIKWLWKFDVSSAN